MGRAAKLWARRRLLINVWDRVKIVVPAILLVAAGFWAAFQFVEPAPPRTLTIASGPENGAYHAFAQRYAARFAREGIRLNVRPTVGSEENLRLLADKDSGVSVAFMQSGIGVPSEHPHLLSLGSVYYEPLWVFVRRPAPTRRLNELKGMRIAIGVPGSGTRPIALRILAANGITAENTKLLDVGGDAAVKGMLAGRIDAAMFVTGAGSSVISRLLPAPGIRLVNFGRADAYARRFRFLSTVTLPEGAVDLARNLPAQEMTLLAPAATIVANPSLHPALAGLLLEAMSQAHREGGLLEWPDEFPSAQYVTFRLSGDARRYYDNGPSLLQRYLPFWAANLVDRLKIMIVPLVTLLYPLFKLLPPTYRWRLSAKINRSYKQLQLLDDRVLHGDVGGRDALMELNHIEDQVMHLSVPAGYADRVYHLRSHIEQMRRRLQHMAERDAGEGGAPRVA